MTVDVSPRAPWPEMFIGDGLFVSFDGWHFRLRAPRDDGDHTVYLDPGVLEAFLGYVKRVNAGENR